MPKPRPTTLQLTLRQKRFDTINYHGSIGVSYLTFLCVVLAALAQVYAAFTQPLPRTAMLFALCFSALTMVLLGLYFLKRRRRAPYYFTAIFLLSTLTMLISWRLSALIQMKFATYLFLLAFVAKIANYIICAYNDVREAKQHNDPIHLHNSRYEWQLLFVRMLMGFILVPHFTEKLFAGSAIRMNDVHAFTALGVPHPLLFVIVAGLMEFASCIAIGCGFLTRLGAIGAFTYLMTATVLGNHFSLGFIWASPGGGWEYPVVWGTLILSFAFFGGDGFSLDHALKDVFTLPRWVRWLMG